MPLSAARVLLHPPKRYALGFDGENDYVEIVGTDTVTHVLKPLNGTVEAYFRCKGGTGSNQYLGRSGGTGWLFGRIEYDLSMFRVWIYDGEYKFVDLGSPSAFIGEWKYAVQTWEQDGFLKGYLDGVEKGSVSIGTPQYDSKPVRLGSSIDADYFYGEIAYFRIYNRALSTSEIQHNYLNPMSPVTDGLVLWLKMEEGSGTTVHDYSGYGNDGTIYGATWIEITHDPIRTLSPVRVLSNVR